MRPNEKIRPNNVKYGKSFLKVKPKFGTFSEGNTKIYFENSL
tara:strand:+ start:799 stop:924 length:126 start_codon:yes stop_codon:yes gene_type:complete